MLLAILADDHWGVRSDAEIFHDVKKKFLDNVFFPTLKNRNINHITHVGDLVDRRKYINFNTAYRMRMDFFEPMHQMGIEMDLILGNHDGIFYKDTLELSFATEMLRGCAHIDYFDKGTEQIFDGLKIAYVPWIVESNRQQISEMIKKTDAKVCFGHLELVGFQQYRGSVALHGEDASNYGKFDLVGSGHYHHRSERGNIHYLGSTGQYNWADYGDERGFHVFDTNTLKLEFIRNPYDMFIKVWYDDNDDCLDLDFSELSGKYVKVIVRNRNKQALYDQFLSRIDESGAVEYSIVDDHLNMDLLPENEIVTDSTNTLTLIKDYIGTLGDKVDVQKLDSLMVDLYKEAHASNE